jgi:hypothetical protein
LEKWIVESIERNSTGRPVVAQMIGNDVPALVRTVKELQQLPIAAIDLNLGCPAPVVYKKCAGGGLLREPQRIDSILGALRDAVSIKFTVKTRVGFESPEEFDALLPIFAKHSIDLLTVHARTVAQMYRLPIHYDLIRRASEAMSCPVLRERPRSIPPTRRWRFWRGQKHGVDDRAGCHSQPVAVRTNPPTCTGRACHLPDRTARAGLHPRACGNPNPLRR